MRVAVVGAGLAGITTAQRLTTAGHAVVVWEKSRGVGGRTATRRGPHGMRFDHGAPFLHDGLDPLSGPALATYDVVRPDGTRVRHAVGEPAANAVAKARAADLDVRTGKRVATIHEQGPGWALTGDDGEPLGTYDAVVVAAPAPQTADLLDGPAPQLAAQARSVAFAPCWSVMAAWDQPLELAFTGTAEIPDLTWALAESPKPGRSPGERWVLQGSAAWSADHLEEEPTAVATALLGRFGTVCGSPLPEPEHLVAHRWRFARPRSPLRDRYLRHGTLLATGDWCGGDTAGAAIRSGRAAADALMADA